MEKAPLILIAPGSEAKGAEFYDYSVSLSDAYTESVLAAGGLPLLMPLTASEDILAEYVRRADGIYLTGGDDVQPELYREKVPPNLRKTVGPTDPKRDLLETMLVKEVFSQRKPLLAICRGHQILNVALGGTLIVDIPTQVDSSINHSQLVHKDRVVHEVSLEGGSLLAKVFGKREIKVNSSHHQAIDQLAKPLQVTGESSDGIIEVVELREEDKGLLPYMLSVQFHPERLIRGYPEYLELFRSFVAACASNGKVKA
jgi:putative glutamine amidotransferase